MHTASNILLTRRSIRQYKPLQITDDQLNAILTAGLFAPSAMNEQAWKLVVIPFTMPLPLSSYLFKKMPLRPCPTALCAWAI